MGGRGGVGDHEGLGGVVGVGGEGVMGETERGVGGSGWGEVWGCGGHEGLGGVVGV